MAQLGYIALALVAATVLIIIAVRPVLRLHGSVQLLGYACALYLVWFGFYVYVQYVESQNEPHATEAVLVIGTASSFSYLTHVPPN